MAAAEGDIEEVEIGPNDGPQGEAFASTADITIYGGGAGGGKSWLTLFRFAVHADRYKGYFGVIFRRTMPMVLAGGGLWEESMGLYPVWGARSNSSAHQWRFTRTDSLVQFRGLQHADDVQDWQGAQLAEFAFEELTQFLESQFWYLFSRLRTKCGMKARAFGTCNPDPDSWVRKLIDWWIGPDGLPIPERAGKKRYFVRDGDQIIWGDTPEEVRERVPHVDSPPQTLRFIPALLADNPQGDPNYRAKLLALPKVERERLLGGNWNARAIAGSYFKRSYFEVIDRWLGRVIRRVRAWDLASTEPHEGNKDPDWTVGVLLAELDDGRWLIEHVERMRESPGKVEAALRRVASQDGIETLVAFWRDPAQAGKFQEERLISLLAGYHVKFVPATRDVATYAGPVSSQAEHGRILVKRGPWNETFLSVLEGFPEAAKDDDVAALARASIELFPDEISYDSSYDTYLPSLRSEQ